MTERLPEQLIRLALSCDRPLYVVGGSVRDFLSGAPLSGQPDWDLASPMSEESLIAAAEKCAFTVKAVYRATGTVKLADSGGQSYEFTRFRSDRYVRGMHAPSEIVFTDDIAVDARRRDFCANAVYYDIRRQAFEDPLGGIADIEEGILRTVAPATKVFGEDGLRLLRLARIAAQTGFSPDPECLAGAKEHAALIGDIVPERIFAELLLLLRADERRADPTAVLRGLHLLNETGVLAGILPELTLGAGMEQRKDFHNYDVLEHSLRCAAYSDPGIRLAALLHDVGKPACFLRDGNYHGHPEEGARIARLILARWKAPNALTEETVRLVALHMRDYNLMMKESKVRREIVDHFDILDKLLLLKQADFSACKDNFSEAPCVAKWKKILENMRAEGAPLTLRELKVDGRDLLEAGVPPQRVGETLSGLLYACAADGSLNRRERLLKQIRRMAEKP